MAKKVNCWEYFGCGRGPDGERIDDLGACPVITAGHLTGVNGGLAGGRCCWVVAGSFSGVPSVCCFSVAHCSACKFLNLVRDEEGRFDFELIPLRVL